MEYLPRWADGREVGAGQRDGAARYEAIAASLAGRREFAVLDVGAYNGYFSLRLAHAFGARAVAADPRPTLRAALDEAADPRVTGIHEALTPGMVREMGHHDVVLCLSVLHHVPYWRDLLAALHEHAGVLYVETTLPDERLPRAVMQHEAADIDAAVESLGGTVIARTAGYRSRARRPLRMVAS